MKRLPVVPDWLLERGTPVAPDDDHPLKDLVAEMVDELDDDDSKALEMWAWEGATYREIADEFGLAGRQGGHYRVLAALKKLRRLLEEHDVRYE